MAGVSYSSNAMWNGGRVTRAVGIGAMIGVNNALEAFRGDSVPLAPLDRGPLRESATVDPATPSRASGALIYDTEYAAIQHEREDFAHTDGQAHYASEPLEKNARVYNRIIGEGIRVALLTS